MALTDKERQIMADIYKASKLRAVKPTAQKFDRIRSSWEK